MSTRNTPGPDADPLRGSAHSLADVAARATTLDRHAAGRMATAGPGTGAGTGASADRSDWLDETITPAAGDAGRGTGNPAGTPVDTSPTDNRKGRAIEFKRGAY